jgi:hypothetical protein
MYGKFTEAESCTVMGHVAENSEFYFHFNISSTTFRETDWRVLNSINWDDKHEEYCDGTPRWERQRFAGKDTIGQLHNFGNRLTNAHGPSISHGIYQSVGPYKHSYDIHFDLFGTIMLYENVTFPDGILRWSMYMVDDDICGIIFRYIDQDNFFLFDMNSENTDSQNSRGRRLIQRINGKYYLLAADTDLYLKNKWHKFVIQFVSGNIKIFQDDAKIFDVDITMHLWDIGSVGLYANYMKGVYFADVIMKSATLAMEFPNSGIVSLFNDYTLPFNHINVTDTLEIIGSDADKDNLFKIIAANGKRHFYIDGENDELTLRYVMLVGGDVRSENGTHAKFGGSIYIHTGGGKLTLYSSILSHNKAYWGGGISSNILGNSNNVIINIMLFEMPSRILLHW